MTILFIIISFCITYTLVLLVNELVDKRRKQAEVFAQLVKACNVKPRLYAHGGFRELVPDDDPSTEWGDGSHIRIDVDLNETTEDIDEMAEILLGNTTKLLQMCAEELEENDDE